MSSQGGGVETVGPPPPEAASPGLGDYMSTRSRGLIGVKFMFIRQATILAMSAGGTTFLLRELGPRVWGGFAISYLLLVTADILLAHGVIAGLLRRTVDADAQMLASAARLVCWVGVAVALLLAVLPFVLRPLYHPPGFPTLMLATSACALLYAGRALPVTLLERELRYGVIAGSEIGDMAVFYLAAIPIVAATGAGVTGLAVATVLRGVVSFSILRTAVRCPLIGARAARAARTLLPFGLPLCAVVGVSTLDALIPVFVIGRDQAALGFLVTGSSLLGYGVAASTAIQRVAIPSFSRLRDSALSLAVSRSMAVATFLTLAALIPLGGLAGLWVVPLLGGAWRHGITTMQIMALALMGSGFLGICPAALTAVGQTRRVLNIQVATTLSYFVAAGVLTVLFGSTGAVIGLVVSRWLSVLMFAVTVAWRLRATISRETYRVLVTGACAYGVMLVASNRSVLVCLAVAAVAYGLWLLLSRPLLAAAARAVSTGVRRFATAG